MPEGNYYLLASHVGYDSARRLANVSEGTTTGVNFALQPLSSAVSVGDQSA